MKAGFSQICINPPYGAPIVGYYQKRLTKGILDSLYTRAVAFDDGEKKAVIIAADLCLLKTGYYEHIKTIVNEATGIDKEAVFITCSHTHTGPLLGKDFASNVESSPSYNDFVFNSMRDAAVYAIADLKETKMETAETQAKNISFIRRYRMKDGSVATNPGVNNKNIDHALGTPNETVKLLKLVRDGADDIFVVNFGTHPDSIGGEYISADYMGYVCSILENVVPNTKCIFLTAPQGDVNHVNVNPTKGEEKLSEIEISVPQGIKYAEHMGRVIAGAVLSVCSITEEVKDGKITFGSKLLDLPTHQENDRLDEAKNICELYESGRENELPYKKMELTTAIAEARRILRLENGPESIPFLLSAIKIGDLVFAGLSGEPFTEIGNRIRENSPIPQMVLCCLTNNSGPYVPTSSAYSEGGYEAKSSSLKPGADDVIVENMTELLKSL